MIYCQCTSEWGSLDGASVAVAKCFWLLKREQSYWSKCAASFTLNIRISSMSEVLFRRSNFAHKLILKTYLSRMYLAFFQQFRLLHFQKQTHKLLQIFEILPPSGPLWGGGGRLFPQISKYNHVQRVLYNWQLQKKSFHNQCFKYRMPFNENVPVGIRGSAVEWFCLRHKLLWNGYGENRKM